MKPWRPEEDIVAFLSFSRSRKHETFQQLSERKWKRVLQWLDDSGLAFYFLQKLKDSDATESVPSWVVSHLQTNFALNELRSNALLERFNAINARFEQVGIPFAVLKGFSLVPDFCPASALRHQSDFDYLVDERSLPAAQEILLSLGYTQRASTSRLESIFLSTDGTKPSRRGRQYSPDSPHAVELHLDVWDAQLYHLPSLPPLFSPEKTCIVKRDGGSFPTLNEEEAFLLQTIHVCHHLFSQWVRTSSLFEIGYFLTRRSTDSALWSQVERRVGTHQILRELVVIATEMASEIFESPVPFPMSRWAGDIRPGARVWLDRYARQWIFSDLPVYELSLLPASKLVQFLHQQYPHDGATDSAGARHTSKSSRPLRMLSAIKRNPALFWNREWWKQQRLLRRTIFHGLATLRYACEIPRWHWRLRKAKKSARRQPAGMTAIVQRSASNSQIKLPLGRN